jgi:hypothetical protein
VLDIQALRKIRDPFDRVRATGKALAEAEELIIALAAFRRDEIRILRAGGMHDDFIGAKVGLTRQRIYQIALKGLRK